MAMLEEIIVTVAASVFPTNRIWHFQADDEVDPSIDYCFFSIISGEDISNNLLGPGSYARARVQFTILGFRSIPILQKEKALRIVMAAANTAGTLKNLPQGPGYDIPGDLTLMRGRIVEFQITSYDPLA